MKDKAFALVNVTISSLSQAGFKNMHKGYHPLPGENLLLAAPSPQPYSQQNTYPLCRPQAGGVAKGSKQHDAETCNPSLHTNKQRTEARRLNTPS